MADHEPRRTVIDHMLDVQLCRELQFVHNCVSASGYRPHVTAATLSHVAAADPRLLPPLVKARQLVWDAVEEAFGMQCELFVEFTGLVGWSAGASIGWHHDANMPYLAQRSFAAVVYLSTAGRDFTGGTFCFQDGPGPLRITPEAGRMIAYDAGEANVHCVEEVTAGERLVLTMWFTRDAAHSEDARVLSQGQVLARCAQQVPDSLYYTPAGVDLRVARMEHAGAQLLLQCSGADGLEQNISLQLGSDSSEVESTCFIGIVREAGGRRLSLGSMHKACLVVFMTEWQVCDHRISLEHLDQPHRVCSCCRSINSLKLGAQCLTEYLATASALLAALQPYWKVAQVLCPLPDTT